MYTHVDIDYVGSRDSRERAVNLDGSFHRPGLEILNTYQILSLPRVRVQGFALRILAKFYYIVKTPGILLNSI